MSISVLSSTIVMHQISTTSRQSVNTVSMQCQQNQTRWPQHWPLDSCWLTGL